MTTETEVKKEEKEKSIWSAEEKENCRTEYVCELIIENGSYQDVTIKKVPTDAFIITYHHEDKVCLDLTRGTRYKLFDMYYDKFKNGIKSIDYGCGTIKPQSWGYQSPQQKKKKRKA